MHNILFASQLPIIDLFFQIIAKLKKGEAIDEEDDGQD